MLWRMFVILCIFTDFSYENAVHVYGPGLLPHKSVMPARYFFIKFLFIDENLYSPDLTKLLEVDINGKSKTTPHCRIWVNKLDRKDGSFIVRYKVYETCYDLQINILYKHKHVQGSPFTFKEPIQPDQCDCPKEDIQTWLEENSCQINHQQIKNDLAPYSTIDMTQAVKKIVQKYHQPESTSFCHYIVKDNEIYRDCYGKHVGFNMFSDNILLSLTRKVKLPDVEMVINLGDWPLVKKSSEPLPVFSWCGSDDTIDIVMPTYDLTESTLENMGRVSLDILSVQSGAERAWSQREPRAVWRGRDSRLERLKLVDIARANPDLFNVSLTNFFFFRDKEEEYGPKQPHISFFKFFDAWKHFVPVKRDLSDLVEKVQWALEHDDEAREIAKNAQNFANEQLLPDHIICYHALLFS
ncbi:KDEL motif-containing protein 1, partial [Operophtera brumata]